MKKYCKPELNVFDFIIFTLESSADGNIELDDIYDDVWTVGKEA